MPIDMKSDYTPKFATVNLVSTSAATAGNYGVFFNVDRAYKVIAITESHAVLGTDGGAVTLNVERLTAGEALDAGDELLATPFDLKASVDNPRTLFPTDVVIKAGERLALKDAGTLTAVAGLSVTVTLLALGDKIQ